MTVDEYLGFFLREWNIITNNHFVIKDLAAKSVATGKGLLEKRLYILPPCPDCLLDEALHQTVEKYMHNMQKLYL